MIALSWSRISDYKTCPAKFNLKYIAKADNFQIDDSSKPIHFIKGEQIHKALEDYTNSVRDGAPEPLSKTADPAVGSGRVLIDRYAADFGQDNIFAEMTLCINSNWEPIEWFSKDAYLRAIVDFSAYKADMSLAVDWKTGKFRSYTPTDGFGQLELTAGFMFALKSVQVVKTEYNYVEHRKSVKREYDVSQFDEIRSHFDEIHAVINAESDWLPKRNEFCHFCPATKSQCPFSRKDD